MKNTIFILALLLSLQSCMPSREDCLKSETINTIFTVTSITHGKHSKVSGLIIYKGILVEIYTNSHRYKNYYLTIGQQIPTTIDVRYYPTYRGYEVIFGNVDLTDFCR